MAKKSPKEYSSVVKIEIAGNNFEAESEEEYIDRVIESFDEEFEGKLTPDRSEIHDIEVMGNQKKKKKGPILM